MLVMQNVEKSASYANNHEIERILSQWLELGYFKPLDMQSTDLDHAGHRRMY